VNSHLLTLVSTPELEERLVDWLLEEGHAGFTSAPCHGHGVHPDRLSTAEQVAGRQRRVVFWLHVPEHEVDDLLAGLATSFGNAGLHYWLAPLIAVGRIESPPSSGPGAAPNDAPGS
jgi:hypothetical protein